MARTGRRSASPLCIAAAPFTASDVLTLKTIHYRCGLFSEPEDEQG